MSEAPRAYTADEARDMILDHMRSLVDFWATVPDPTKTTKDRLSGLAFSICSMLDGCSLALPAITLVMDPHEEDKEYLRSQGENWFEPGTEVADMLHEHFYQNAKE